MPKGFYNLRFGKHNSVLNCNSQWNVKEIKIAFGDNEPCSNSKVEREITKQEQSKHGSLKKK